MAVLTVTEQDFAVLPDDTIIGVTVDTVTVKDVERKDGSGSFQKLDFKFKVDSVPSALDSEFGFLIGNPIWGNTGANLTSHPDNKLRQWAEALLNIGPLETGFELDTDNLEGLSARAIISSYDKKAGGRQHTVGALLSFDASFAPAAPQTEALPLDEPDF
jgi:hypothetical protein